MAMGNKRRNDVSDEEVIEVFRRVGTALQAAKETGIGQTTVFRILERHGIPRPNVEDIRQMRAKFGEDRAKAILEQYEGGATFADLVREHGGSEHSIKRAIRSAGGSLVPVTPALTEGEKRRVLELVAEGVSQMKISLLLERSQSSVTRFCRAQGIRHRKATGENHGRWRGGRYQNKEGYWRVRLGADDPFAEMRLHDGYVAEHRLVMARKLGRALRRNETVHHINGDKSDNRPENLQLRHGNHGKHAAMQCLDCGSHNIGHVPLKE